MLIIWYSLESRVLRRASPGVAFCWRDASNLSPPHFPLMTKSRNSDCSPESSEARLSSTALFHPAVRDWFNRYSRAPLNRKKWAGPPSPAANPRSFWHPQERKNPRGLLVVHPPADVCCPYPKESARCRVLYISPIKALAVDVERNLRAPLVGISQAAKRAGDCFSRAVVAVRTGDTPAAERARFLRHPSDILITTPESLYLLLTSNARESLRSIETAVVDEIHALVPAKRGSHLALSIERLEHLCGRNSSASGFLPRSGRSTKSRTSGGAHEIARAGPRTFARGVVRGR